METVLQIGDIFQLKTGETATIVKIEDYDKTIPETKPLRETFGESPISYIIDIKGREGQFKINETDVKKILNIKEPGKEPSQEELDEMFKDFDISKFLKEMRGEDIEKDEN